MSQTEKRRTDIFLIFFILMIAAMASLIIFGGVIFWILAGVGAVGAVGRLLIDLSLSNSW
jgi:hypothetical protein